METMYSDLPQVYYEFVSKSWFYPTLKFEALRLAIEYR